MRGRSGATIAKVTIDGSGRVRECHVLRSTIPELNDAVIRNVMQWRYAPSGHEKTFLQPFSFKFE